MSKKLTPMQLRMAALSNNKLEAGIETYKDPEVRKKIKNNIMSKKG